MPKLSEHLAKFPEVDLAAVTTGWFLGLFFDCLPFQVSRIKRCCYFTDQFSSITISFSKISNFFKIESSYYSQNAPSFFDLCKCHLSFYSKVFTFLNFSFQTLIRVWDCFLAFGHEAMFRVAYAMFKLFEDRLVELNEPSQLLHAAKNIPKLCTHPGQLIKVSCEFFQILKHLSLCFANVRSISTFCVFWG